MTWRIRVIKSKGWVKGEDQKPEEYPTKKAAQEDLNECFVHPKSYEIVEYGSKTKKKRKKKKTPKKKE